MVCLYTQSFVVAGSRGPPRGTQTGGGATSPAAGAQTPATHAGPARRGPMPVPGQVSPFSPCSPSSPSGSDGGTPASASWRRSPVNAWLSKGLSIDRLAPQTPGRPSRPWPVESADHEPPSVCPSSASSSATGGPGGAAKKEKRRREHEASSFFTSYWFDQKAQDCSFERKRRKDLRCQLEDLLRSSQADLGGVKDTLANPAEAAQRGADAVMRVADVGADCVVGAANDGIGVLRDLASDVEDTAQAITIISIIIIIIIVTTTMIIHVTTTITITTYYD